MAKKAKTSARSKGYRKTVQKKPFLTKKEIIALVAIVAAIALAILLFNLLYDDGSLDVVDGVVQTENFDNSVIVQDHIGDETKYFKVAEVGELEGYTREREENSANANLATFVYTPEDETSPIDYIRVSGGSLTPDGHMENDVFSYTMSGIPIEAQGSLDLMDATPSTSSPPLSMSSRMRPPRTRLPRTIPPRTRLPLTQLPPTRLPRTRLPLTQLPPTGLPRTRPPPTTAADATAADDTADETATDTAADATATDETVTDATAADAETATEETEAALERYDCQQAFSAYVGSKLNDNYSIAVRIYVNGTTETAVDAEGLATYTEGLYLTEDELLSYLEEVMQAIDPVAAE